jgi:hypothetical protein
MQYLVLPSSAQVSSSAELYIHNQDGQYSKAELKTAPAPTQAPVTDRLLSLEIVPNLGALVLNLDLIEALSEGR